MFGAMRTPVVLVVAAACSLLAVLSSCSRSSGTGRSAAAGALGGDASAAATNAATGASDADFVAAVSNASSTTPIAVRFRIGSRPVVGKPFTIEILVQPDEQQAVSHIHLTFAPTDGLALEGDATIDAGEREAKAGLRRELRVTASQAGVLSLGATALVDTDTLSITRTYLIPVIASGS